MSIQNVKKMALFCVSVREKRRNKKHRTGYLDVLVVANSISDARRLGVAVCEAEGLINRTNINDTLVYEQESEVYHHA